MINTETIERICDTILLTLDENIPVRKQAYLLKGMIDNSFVDFTSRDYGYTYISKKIAEMIEKEDNDESI